MRPRTDTQTHVGYNTFRVVHDSTRNVIMLRTTGKIARRETTGIKLGLPTVQILFFFTPQRRHIAR